MIPLKPQKKCKLNYYRRLLKKTPELLGISEKAYAQALFTGAAEETQVCVSMFVLGPVLLAFVSWVLKQAQESGKSRLYFLARDGWLMYRMAQSLCKAAGAHSPSTGIFPEGNLPECRYLYASRYAWRLPEQHLIGEKSLERICRGGMHVTFADMMRRAGLTAEEAKRIAALVCPERSMEEALAWSEIQGLRIPLSGCDEFRAFADRHSRSRYEAAIAYLSQEGLLEEIPCWTADGSAPCRKALLIFWKAPDTGEKWRAIISACTTFRKGLTAEAITAGILNRPPGRAERRIFPTVSLNAFLPRRMV